MKRIPISSFQFASTDLETQMFRVFQNPCHPIFETSRITKEINHGGKKKIKDESEKILTVEENIYLIYEEAKKFYGNSR